MDNLSLGDNYKPLDAYFQEGKRRNNQSAPTAKAKEEIPIRLCHVIACQIFEKQLAALSVEDKESFPVCKYNPNQRR